MGIIKTGKIQSHGDIVGLTTRIAALEDKYVKALWYAEIGSGTSGTITPPANGTIVLNEFGNDVDAVTSTITTTKKPDFISAKTSAGAIVTATLAANGAWTISGAPSAYPIALVYVYEVKLVNFDHDSSLYEEEFGQGVQPADSPTFAGLTVDALSGVLKATAGAVAGGAAHSELATIGANDHHNAITLDTNADTLLSLSTQALGLDTKAANLIFSGPTTGAAAVPTFRALVNADLPASLSPSIMGLTLSGLTASLPLVTDGNKALASLAYTGATSFRKNLGLETSDIPILAGLVIPSISPAADFSLNQNSVAVLTSIAASAVANTLYLKEGNVGIGTTGPLGKLHIKGTGAAELGNAAINGDIVLQGSGLSSTFGGAIGTFDGASQYMWIQSRYTDSATYRSLVLNPNGGNVGIGDAAPGELLDVAGNINATGVIKIDDVQVLSNQGLHVVDATAVSGTATLAGYGFVSAAEMNTAITNINTIQAQLNALIARCEAHGLLASA